MTKAQDLARKFGGRPVPFEGLHDHLTSRRGPHLHRLVAPDHHAPGFEPLLRRRRCRPIFLIDIAVPRDVEASVGELDAVYLYNLDDLQQVVLSTQGQRREAVESARKIVARLAGRGIPRLAPPAGAGADDRPAVPLLPHPGPGGAGPHAGEAPDVGEAERRLEELTRRIVNKLLHGPIRRCARSSPHSPGGGTSTPSKALRPARRLRGRSAECPAEPTGTPRPMAKPDPARQAVPPAQRRGGTGATSPSSAAPSSWHHVRLRRPVMGGGGTFQLLSDRLLIAFWLLGATCLVAALVRPFLREDDVRDAGVLWFVTSAATGLGVFSLITLGLGLAGWLNQATAWALPSAGLVTAIVRFARRGKAALVGAEDFLRAWLSARAGAGFGWQCCRCYRSPPSAATLPPGMLWHPDEPHGYDVVEYHLQIPREWYEAGRIIPYAWRYSRISRSTSR